MNFFGRILYLLFSGGRFEGIFKRKSGKSSKKTKKKNHKGIYSRISDDILDVNHGSISGKTHGKFSGGVIG